MLRNREYCLQISSSRYTKAGACIAIPDPPLYKDCNLIALVLFTNCFITKQSRLHRATNTS